MIEREYSGGAIGSIENCRVKSNGVVRGGIDPLARWRGER